MYLKYQHVYFLVSALVKIVIGVPSQFISDKNLNDLAMLIRDLNSENNNNVSQETVQDSTHEDDNKNNIKALLGKHLRDINKARYEGFDGDRICKKYGKCPCDISSKLCSIDDFYEVADEVDRIINEINERANRNGKDMIHENKRMDRQRVSSTSSENPDNKEIDDDNLLSDDTPKRNLLQVVAHFKESSESNSLEKSKLSKAVTALTPEDMANYYRPAMDDLRKIILGYIKYRSNFKRVRGLPKIVRGGIQTLREKYRHFKVSDKVLSKQIFNILLDDVKKIKIVPNNNPQAQFEIYVPEWIYLEVLKRKEGRRLRTNKRLLPLTLHQKFRMQNKLRPKKLVKFAWRRNMGSGEKKYGVPFVLDVHGLGQIA